MTTTHEDVAELSMLAIAHNVLEEEKKAFNFYDLMKKVAEIKGFSEEEYEERIAQFYTNLNIDGRFLCLGDNMWGLKKWYPVDKIDEEFAPTPKKKKKKKTTKKTKKADKEAPVEEDHLEDDLLDEDDFEIEDL